VSREGKVKDSTGSSRNNPGFDKPCCPRRSRLVMYSPNQKAVMTLEKELEGPQLEPEVWQALAVLRLKERKQSHRRKRKVLFGPL